MTVKHQLLTIDGTETHLSNWNSQKSESSFMIQNISSGNLYIGAKGVTTSNYGFYLGPGQTMSMTLGPYDEIYGISNGTVQIAILVLEN